MGAILVFGQLVGLIVQQGEFIVKVNNVLAKPTFTLSSMTGVLGFIITAIKKRSSNLLTDEEKEEKLLDKKIHKKVL